MADLSQKYKLLKGLCNGEYARTGPFFVTLDLTRRCNLHCLGCRFHSKEAEEPLTGDQEIRDFPFGWAERLFSELSQLNTRTMFFMGEGEPFIYPRIFDIFRLAKDYGFYTTVTTNGTLIDETKAERVIDAGLDEMHVSLWTDSREDYAIQYSGTDPENLQRVIDGMRILSSLKKEKGSQTPRIVLTNPINRFNHQKVDVMFTLAKEIGCDAISYTPFKTNRGKLARYALSEDQQKDLCHHMIGLRKQIRTNSLGDNIRRLLARYRFNPASHEVPCYIHWFHSRIKVDGSVLSCGRSERILGSLKTESFTDIWNGNAYCMERRKMLSPSGVTYRNEICDCEHCSFVEDNMAIHRRVKYLIPVLSFLKGGHRRGPNAVS
ncbi:MAG: radical SAM protein [Deltaproteobacteria bacterium]|nr:radical SAM protein [Deltaproteobacteria bacterium]